MANQNKKQDTVTITMEEFSTLQNQILQLKQEKYEFLEKENRRKIELEKTSQALLEKDKEIKRLNALISQMKDKSDVNAIMNENKSLLKTIAQLTEEYNETQTTLKNNIKSLYELNQKLQQELDQLKEEKKE